MYCMLYPVITCMITCHYMLPFCITCWITWYWAAITCHYMLPTCITCPITWYESSYYMMFFLPLHVITIYYMPHYMISLIAAAAELEDSTISARNQRARYMQSCFCWTHFAREYSSMLQSLWSPCSNVVAASMRLWQAVLGILRMWLQNIQAILRSSKI